MPSIPELIGRLADGTVELRAIAEWDIPEILIAHQDDRELARRLGMDKPPTGAQLGSEVEHEPSFRNAGHSASFTIVDPGGNDCRGRVELSAIDWDAKVAQAHVWVAPDRRGRGYAAAATELVTNWLKQQAGIDQLTVSAVVDD